MQRVHSIPALPRSGSIRLAAFQIRNSRFRDGMTGLHTARSEMKSIPFATVLPPTLFQLFQRSASNVFLHDPTHWSAGVHIVRSPRFTAFPLQSR